MYLEYDSFLDDFGRFRRFCLNAHGRMNTRTHGRTDGWTDRPFYRDARTHLKKQQLIHEL